ncbi:50S ribosomal protein L6 [Patescibacteria group bacterium]|nr:50S ribosomal protein L6 [Patescibacteria group bacterium]MCL5114776.1 50S ribosomal protein L6 [Patescibacteria group bacterium]
MSKIGKQPITIPEGVTVTVADNHVSVKGPKGELTIPILTGITVSMEDKALTTKAESRIKQVKSNWGTERALLQNAVTGVLKGFEKTLILEGVGYRVMKEGENLNLSLGFSHPVKFPAPKGISFEVEKNSILKIRGVDKNLVGKTAADIRQMKKPEPYKGKGFHYEGEVVRRKAGKKAATTSAA